MSLLAIEHVERHHRQGSREHVVLRGVSLRIDAGELVAIWGPRRSGRSTLLRIASGVESPDSGVVRFDGHNLAERGVDALGKGIGYCQCALRSAESHIAVEELIVGQLARGVPLRQARVRAWAALERAGASDCAARVSRELDGAEQTRVTLARALALEPSLLVADEPTGGVDLLQRDAILSLLRSLADEGIAILMSTGDGAALSGADRALSLSCGELRGSRSPELATVVPLHRAASAR